MLKVFANVPPGNPPPEVNDVEGAPPPEVPHLPRAGLYDPFGPPIDAFGRPLYASPLRHRCSDYYRLPPGYARITRRGLVIHDPSRCPSSSSESTDFTMISDEE